MSRSGHTHRTTDTRRTRRDARNRKAYGMADITEHDYRALSIQARRDARTIEAAIAAQLQAMRDMDRW